MTYNEEHVAAMALSNILTSLHVLTTLDCINDSVYLNAHIVLIENSIGALADNLTNAEDGAMGSNIVEMANVIVKKSGQCSSDKEVIRQNAIEAITRLQGKMMSEEYKQRESQN